jgi:hypothetical protein
VGEYFISYRNAGNSLINGFTVDCQSVELGLNFSWTGGSGGVPTSSPTNRNHIHDIAVVNATTLAINFDQQHESDLAGITASTITADGIGIRFSSTNGHFALRSSVIAKGKLSVSAPSMSMFDVSAYDGLTLFGPNPDIINWNGGQIFPNDTTGNHIDASASTGNSSQGSLISGVTFGAGAINSIVGRFLQGIVFTGCRWAGYTNMFGVIAPVVTIAPLFTYINCTFANTTPQTSTATYRTSGHSCLTSTAAIASWSPLETYTPIVVSEGGAWTPGASTAQGRYIREGSKITVNVHIVYGAGVSVPTGNIAVKLPFPAAANGLNYVGSAVIVDDGTWTYGCIAVINSDRNYVNFIHNRDTGNFGMINTTVPFFWAVGDRITLVFEYEV